MLPLRSPRPLREAKFVVKLGSDEVHQDRFQRPNRLGTGLLWIGRWRKACNAADGARSRKAEDGAIDPKYPLKETPWASYLQRTEWNVRDSDGTVFFSVEPTMTGGLLKTLDFARKHNKPRLNLHPGLEDPAGKLRTFLQENSVNVLNVAGPRASNEPGVGEFVTSTLDKAFTCN